MSAYATSDALKRLKERFSRHSTITINAAGVTFIVEEIDLIFKQALALEHEVSRLCWNNAARQDREQEARVLEEAARPGLNVRFFPVQPRSAFSDGNPKGAA